MKRARTLFLILLLLFLIPKVGDAESTEEWNKKGREYFSTREFNKAVECYDKALGIKPNYAEAYKNRGLAYYNLGRYKKALNNYKKACDLGNTDGCHNYHFLNFLGGEECWDFLNDEDTLDFNEDENTLYLME